MRANLGERNRSCFKQPDEVLAGDIEEISGLLHRQLAIVEDELHAATGLKLDEDLLEHRIGCGRERHPAAIRCDEHRRTGRRTRFHVGGQKLDQWLDSQAATIQAALT